MRPILPAPIPSQGGQDHTRVTMVDLYTGWIAIMTVILLSPFQGELKMLLSMQVSPINQELTGTLMKFRSFTASFALWLTLGSQHTRSILPHYIFAGKSLFPLLLRT